MSRFVSVVIPTYNHGVTLRASVRSALAQTHDSLEVLIVGDGMPEPAVAVAEELERDHAQVQAFFFAKTERQGEPSRHQVITEHARGDSIFYLSDDDLWLPEHVETVLERLAVADVAGATMATIDEAGSLRVTPQALERDGYRRLHLGAHNRVALSGLAHTRAAYERIEGWTPTPPGVYTDHYFLKKLLADPGIAAASSAQVTWLNFPSPMRRQMSNDERLAELERWWRRVADPSERAALDLEIQAAWVSAALEFDELAIRLTEAYEAHERQIDDLRTRLDDAGSQLASAQRSWSWRATAPFRRAARVLRRR
jgi:glycosyltransferase involved in cell wall biosynthesis